MKRDDGRIEGLPREERRLVTHQHAGGVTVASRVAYGAHGECLAWCAAVYARGTPIAVSAKAAGVDVCAVLGHVKLHGVVGCPACGAAA